MIGMRSTPEQDLQELQPVAQPMPQPMMQSPQPMPSPMPMPQMGSVPWPMPPGGAGRPTAPMNPQMAPTGGLPKADTKGSIVKKAVKKAGGKSEGNGTKDQGVMKWMMDYLNKRHETSLNHEREVLKSILEEQRQRGGAAPESMRGHEQEYYDQTINTGNRI